MSKPPGSYSSKEVSSLTELSLRQLAYWEVTGMVVPSIGQARGSGTRRYYSVDDIILLRCIRILQDNGWSTQRVRRFVNAILDVIQDSDPIRYVFTMDKDGATVVCKTIEGIAASTSSLESSNAPVLYVVLDTLVPIIRNVVQLAFTW